MTLVLPDNLSHLAKLKEECKQVEMRRPSCRPVTEKNHELLKCLAKSVLEMLNIFLLHFKVRPFEMYKIIPLCSLL